MEIVINLARMDQTNIYIYLFYWTIKSKNKNIVWNKNIVINYLKINVKIQKHTHIYIYIYIAKWEKVYQTNPLPLSIFFPLKSCSFFFVLIPTIEWAGPSYIEVQLSSLKWSFYIFLKFTDFSHSLPQVGSNFKSLVVEQ